jgi:hypothetical protein
LTQFRRWLVEGGKFGQPPPDLEVIELAMEFRVCPAEVEEWPLYWIRRIQLYKQAHLEAADVRRKRSNPQEQN